MLQGVDKRLIVEHALIISFFFLFHLLHEQILLDEWIIEFSEGVAELHILDEEFESLSETRLGSVIFGKRRHQLRMLDDESWVEALGFQEFANELVYKPNGSPWM